MAGDWIKMRSALFTHPRFIALSERLTHGFPAGMLLYAYIRHPEQDEESTPAQQASEYITTEALRDVAMVALLKVWCTVNSHCKVVGTDATMSPMNLDDLDRLVGFDGFGAALEGVGWVVQKPKNTLLFPNFLEFNEPACLRSAPKTNAERQREFRSRKSNAHRNGVGVTRKRDVTTDQRRSEKIRSDVSTKHQSDQTDASQKQEKLIAGILAAQQIATESLTDIAKLMAIAERLAQDIPFFGTQVGQQNILGAALYVQSRIKRSKVAVRNPPGLFSRIVARCEWHKITSKQSDVANAAWKTFKHGGPGHA